LDRTKPTPLIVIAGPTGAGKSHLAVELALRFGGEIVNCDSVQVYRGLDVGSAKPTLEERRGVLHHLLDLVPPDAELTAGAYARLASRVLAEITERTALPIVVGGTGFYLRALLDGLSPAPLRDEQLRARLAHLALRRPNALHRFLRRIDPTSAQRIHRNDHQKLIRAIELSILAGRPASEVQNAARVGLRGFKALKIGLDPARAALHQNINRRTESMFSGGLLTETKSLLQSGLSPRTKSLHSLGYKQAADVLTAGKPLPDAIVECQAKTRQYAKRQLTWFRADHEIFWIHGFGTDPFVQAEATAKVQDFLSNDLLRGSQF
jgi:tRNA dimethylallyltransferase